MDDLGSAGIGIPGTLPLVRFVHASKPEKRQSVLCCDDTCRADFERSRHPLVALDKEKREGFVAGAFDL